MALKWLDWRLYAENTPVAPISSQQAATHWEPSVQDMVRDIGGYKVEELEEAIATRWKLKFKIGKVWRAMDAISNKGIHSYLQHHWAILRLEPTGFEPASNTQLTGIEHESRPAVDQAPTGHLREAEVALQVLQRQKSLKRNNADQDNEDGKPRKRSASGETTAASACDPQPSRSDKAENLAPGHSSVAARGDIGEEADVFHLTTATSLSLRQQELLQPSSDAGLQLADAGKTWFLRIDRFNEADKWFACGSFENALLSEQARERHYSPTSEISYEAVPGRQPLLLDCIVPLLSRLAEIKYSVFAKGNHCQWHARIVTCLAASLSYFLDPESVTEDCRKKVTPILTDGKEQQRYTAAAGKFSGCDTSEAAGYIRERPEAPYLKACVKDLKQLATAHPDTLPVAVINKPFPDLQLIYSSLK